MDAIGKSRLVVDLPADVKAKFQAKCEMQDSDMSEKINTWVADYVGDKPAEGGKCLTVRRRKVRKN